MITAQDIGALAMMEKLTRIWVPTGTSGERISAGLERLVYKNGIYLKFAAEVGENTCFHYSEGINFWQLFSSEPFPSDDEEPGYKFYGHMGCLSFDDGEDWDGIFSADIIKDNPGSRSYNNRKAFTKKWMAYFRRNLWLCGCDIDCTTQERSEWIQGLTLKEIEAWRLAV